jgi:hypothetical protein
VAEAAPVLVAWAMTDRTDVIPVREANVDPLGRRALAHIALLRAIYGEDEWLDFAEDELPHEEEN